MGFIDPPPKLLWQLAFRFHSWIVSFEIQLTLTFWNFRVSRCMTDKTDHENGSLHLVMLWPASSKGCHADWGCWTGLCIMSQFTSHIQQWGSFKMILSLLCQRHQSYIFKKSFCHADWGCGTGLCIISQFTSNMRILMIFNIDNIFTMANLFQRHQSYI